MFLYVGFGWQRVGLQIQQVIQKFFSGRHVVSRDALEASALLHDSIISRLTLVTLFFSAFRRKTMTKEVFI